MQLLQFDQNFESPALPAEALTLCLEVAHKKCTLW
jgi:hypothetical protein